MTIEEAIAHAKEQTEIFSGTHGKFLDMAIEALEKQIPKKPNKAIDSTWGVKKEVNVCPVCDYYLPEVYFINCGDMKNVTFCETCGQKIDWEVGE